MEAQEIDARITSDDNSLPPNSAIVEWCDLLQEGIVKAGLSLQVTGSEYKQMMEDAGFVDVQVIPFKVPIGPWPKDERLREAGRANLVATLDGVHSMMLAIWTRLLERNIIELELFLQRVRKEMMTRSVHSYWPL